MSELSGRSNIVALTARHNLQDDRQLMDKILSQVVALENSGYQFEAAEASFDLLVRRARGFFDRISSGSATTSAWGATSGEVQTEATVKLRVGDEIRHEVAEGDGPVNALDAAMRKALGERFPSWPKCTWSIIKSA